MSIFLVYFILFWPIVRIGEGDNYPNRPHQRRRLYIGWIGQHEKRRWYFILASTHSSCWCAIHDGHNVIVIKAHGYCNQWYHCGDVALPTCKHTFHPLCLVAMLKDSNKCKICMQSCTLIGGPLGASNKKMKI